jgi:hypothetical protein
MKCFLKSFQSSNGHKTSHEIFLYLKQVKNKNMIMHVEKNSLCDHAS